MCSALNVSKWLKQEGRRVGKVGGEREGGRMKEGRKEGRKETREGGTCESKKSQIVQACNMSTVHITVRA